MIGSKIRTVRQSLGLTQIQVCTDICDRSLLSHIEGGRVTPSLDVLEKICERLGVSVSDVIINDEYSTDAKKLLDELEEHNLNRDYDLAIKYGRQILRLKEIANHSTALSECLREIGIAYHESLRYTQALYFMEEAYNSSLHCSSITKFKCANSYSAVLINTGHYQRAFQLLHDTYMLSETVPIRDQTRIRIVYNLANVARKLGRTCEARLYIRDGLHMCRKTAIFDCRGHLETLNALMTLEQGKLNMAMSSFQQALRVYEILEDREGIVGCCINIAELLRDKRDFETCRLYILRGLSWVEDETRLGTLKDQLLELQSNLPVSAF